MKLRRIISLIVAVMMLFPLAIAFADGEESSGSSRAGDTATWTATGNGGTTGYSDTITYDDVEDSPVGSNTTLNSAYKSKDGIEDKIGDWLESHGDMKLSTIFWDGVHGRYINVEEYGYTHEQLMKLAQIANEYLKYKADAEHTIHLVDEVIEEAENKKQDFSSKVKAVNTKMFDPASYNPDKGIFGGPNHVDPKKPDLSAFLDELYDFFKNRDEILEGAKPKVLQIIEYDDFMKAYYGNDVFDKHPEWKLALALYANPYRGGDSITNAISKVKGYPAKEPPIFKHGQSGYLSSTTGNPSFGNVLDESKYVKDNSFAFGNRYPDGQRSSDIDFYVFGYDSKTYVQSTEWAATNYRLLKNSIAKEMKYDPDCTVIKFTDVWSYSENSQDYISFYIFDGYNYNILHNLIKDRSASLHTREMAKIIKQVEGWSVTSNVFSFFRGFQGDDLMKNLPAGAVVSGDSTPPDGYVLYAIVLNCESNPYASVDTIPIQNITTTYVFVTEDSPAMPSNLAEQIAEHNQKAREEAAQSFEATTAKTDELLENFMKNNGDTVAEIEDYLGMSFPDVVGQLNAKQKLALSAIIGKYFVDDRLSGGNPEDVLDGLVDDNLANADATAAANKAKLDAAKGEAIKDMIDNIDNNTDIVTSGKWPGVSGCPDDYDYEQALANLKETFHLSDSELNTFVTNLLETISTCNEESFGISGLGPDGKIVDYETKEGRYLALQGYLLLMCARDTINVQHITVCEGNSYVDNVIMSQSPMQFPAEVVGSNGVANYCWAIQCVESKYAGDVGRYVAKATNGNQLSYRFTSPGKYRIVATRNMLSTIETVVAMTYHEYWIIEETGQVIYSRIVKGHVNTVGSSQFNPAGRQGDDVCLYFNRHGEQSCYSDGDAETGIPGTVVFETYWTVTDGDGNYIPPAGAFGSDSSTRQTG